MSSYFVDSPRERWTLGCYSENPKRTLQPKRHALTLILTVAAVYDDHEEQIGDSPSEINFLIFVAVWTLLVLAFLLLAPKFFPKAAHNLVILALEFITMLLWFAGFIALAVDVGAYGCDVLEDLLGEEFDDCQTADSSAKAAVAFAAFTWSVN